MSGPCELSAGRAEKANQAPSGEYDSDCPTTMTSWAISMAPVVGEAEIATLAVEDGVAEGDVRGVGVGDAVATGVASGVGVIGGSTVAGGLCGWIHEALGGVA